MKQAIKLRLNPDKKVNIKIQFNTPICVGHYDKDWNLIQEADFYLEVGVPEVTVDFDAGAYFYKDGTFYDYTDPIAQQLLKEGRRHNETSNK